MLSFFHFSHLYKIQKQFRGKAGPESRYESAEILKYYSAKTLGDWSLPLVWCPMNKGETFNLMA